MKATYLTVFLMAICFSLFAQKEVFFADTTNIEESYVQKTIHGLGLNVSAKTNLLGRSWDALDLGLRERLFYFHESRLAPTITLNKTAGIMSNIYRDYGYEYEVDENGNIIFSNNSFSRLTCMLNAYLSVEPRWYFTQKSRYLQGKAMLNSGWYLGLPLELYIDYYKTDYPGYPTHKGFNVPLSLSASLGYRHAFSQHFFLEGNFQAGGFNLYSNFPISSEYSGYCEFVTNFSVQLQLKAAYRF